jgi:hypothetical protein
MERSQVDGVIGYLNTDLDLTSVDDLADSRPRSMRVAFRPCT